MLFYLLLDVCIQPFCFLIVIPHFVKVLLQLDKYFYLFVCFGLSSRLRLELIGICFPIVCFYCALICLLTKAIKISPEL